MSAKTSDDRYNTRLDNKYGYLTVIDIPAEVAEHAPWFNQTLTKVNDSVVRLGILQGEYHWHKHDNEDECFVVLDGELLLDVEGRGTITLGRAPRLHGAEGRSASDACADEDDRADDRGGDGHADGRLSANTIVAAIRARAPKRSLDRSGARRQFPRRELSHDDYHGHDPQRRGRPGVRVKS